MLSRVVDGEKMSSPDEASDLGKDLEYWMTNLPQRLRSIPIVYLAIPGSHDSFTGKINSRSGIAPDAEDILKKLEFLGPLLKYFMVKWSRTQTYMATDQLKNGIRYFDLRIATKSGTDDLFIVHGLYSENVQTICDDIGAFLDTHPQEIVILDCQHFYAFTQADHERFMQMLEKIFGTKLLPFSDHMDYITLEYMTTQYRYQVIVIYRSDAARFGQPLFWPSSSFPNPWPNTMSQTQLFAALDYGLKNRKSNTAYISQCVLTPTNTTIFAHLFSTLKKICAIDLEKSKLDWIERQTPGDTGMNIIISDFIELSNCKYVKEVISLNEILLNKSLKSSDTLETVLDDYTK